MLLYILAFFIMAFGILSFFGLVTTDKKEYARVYQDLIQMLPQRKVPIAKQIKVCKKPVKIKGLRKMVMDAKGTLVEMNRSGRFPALCITAGLLLIIGILISGSLDNIYLMPVLGIGLSTLPFIYILLSSYGYKKRLIVELETCLSITTAEYNRSSDIIQAIQENVGYFHSPVKEVFQSFLGQVQMVNPNVPLALRNMKKGLNNEVFHEWIDAVILSENDPSQKSSLMTIVRKLSDIRIVTGDLNADLYSDLRDYIIIGVLLLFEPVIMWALNPEWGILFLTTTVGKITFAIDLVLFFYSLVQVVRLTRPVEYKR